MKAILHAGLHGCACPAKLLKRSGVPVPPEKRFLINHVTGLVDPASLDLKRLNELAGILGVPGLKTDTPQKIFESAYLPNSLRPG